MMMIDMLSHLPLILLVLLKYEHMKNITKYQNDNENIYGLQEWCCGGYSCSRLNSALHYHFL